jgi:hypothetical protein
VLGLVQVQVFIALQVVLRTDEEVAMNELEQGKGEWEAAVHTRQGRQYFDMTERLFRVGPQPRPTQKVPAHHGPIVFVVVGLAVFQAKKIVLPARVFTEGDIPLYSRMLSNRR